MRRAGLLLAPLLLASASAALAQGTDAGKAIYEKNCAQCHGDKGDGNGPAAVHLMPRPRDFTSGKFKIRTTPNGALPTDDDLKSIIRHGMPYTSMPPWTQFTEVELTALVAYVKSLHPGFADPARAPKRMDFPTAPPVTADSAEKGGKIYASLGCANCHGEAGRADGPSSPTLKDDFGNPIRAANLSHPWTFRGGGDRADVFRTLSTGLNGTPMPSFQDALKPEERWQLTDFIASLAPGGTPNYNSLVIATPVEDEIDVTKATTQFDKAPASRIPTVGQIMEPGREFHPPVTSVLVRAIYDQDKIAFLVSWDDTHADTTGKNAPDLKVPQAEEDEEVSVGAAAPAAGGDVWGEAAAPAPAAAPADDVWGESAGGAAAAPAGSEFSDAVALQLPVSIPPGATKPYFLFGDGSNPVDLWFLDLAATAGRVKQFVGRGSASVTALEASEAEGHASFDKGTWSAVFVRSLRSTTGVSFTEDQFVPVAVTVWDGSARERGNRRAVTQWAYVYLPPREHPSPLVPMAAAGAGVLALELLVVFALRRRRARAGVVAV